MALAIQLTIRMNGGILQPTYVNYESNPVTSPYGSYGAIQLDDETSVQTFQTAVAFVSEGHFDIDLSGTDPPEGYRYAIRIKHLNEDFYFERVTTTSQSIVVFLPDSSSYLTSEAEVVRMLGELAVDLILEDLAQDTTSLWKDILSYVDETLELYVGEKYLIASHLTNPFMRRRATILAAYYLSQRRGNPGLYIRQFTMVMDELKMIHEGELKVPGGIPFGYQGPVVRNYVMQPYVAFPQRVQSAKSTGDAYSGEKIAVEPYLLAR